MLFATAENEEYIWSGNVVQHRVNGNVVSVDILKRIGEVELKRHPFFISAVD